jgi:hypothetical protein
MLAKIYKSGTENRRFPTLFGSKNAKTQFFAEKYLVRFTPNMFFEEYINLNKFCYLRRCEVIPVQSFRSHIRPQPSKLGLMF